MRDFELPNTVKVFQKNSNLISKYRKDPKQYKHKYQ